MVRVWILRDMLVTDPFRAARDASTQALAVEVSHAAGLDYATREDEGHAEAFLTGDLESARQALVSLKLAGIPLGLAETNTEPERESLAGLCFSMPGGVIGDAPYLLFAPSRLELVGPFRGYGLPTVTPEGQSPLRQRS